MYFGAELWAVANQGRKEIGGNIVHFNCLVQRAPFCGVMNTGETNWSVRVNNNPMP